MVNWIKYVLGSFILDPHQVLQKSSLSHVSHTYLLEKYNLPILK